MKPQYLTFAVMFILFFFLPVIASASKVNGNCGSANGSAFTSASALNSNGNFCSSGTASPGTASGSGPWTWTCLGSGGGTNSSTCSASVAYTITVTQGSNGTISPGTTTVSSGGSQAFTITASSGYAVSGVTVDGSSVGAVTNYTFSNVTANHTITASFIKTYTISGTIKTSGGTAISGVTVTLTGAGSSSTTTNSSGQYSFSGAAPGSYTITPSLSGYTFSSSSLSVTVSSSNLSNENFTGTPIVNGACGSANGGSYTSAPSGSILCSAGTASTVTQGASTWTWSCTGSNGGTNSPTCSASIAHTITVTQGSNGTIAPGTTTVSYGGSQAFTITANSGYAISGVTVDGSSVGAVTSYTFSNVTANHTITASFIQTYTISGTIKTSGGTAISGVTVTLTGAGSSSTTTNSSGQYSFSGAAPGSYTITPSLSGYTFSPSSLPVTVNNSNLSNENFTGTPIINGACGSASGGSYTGSQEQSLTSAQLCNMGTNSAVGSSNTQWTWSCLGSNGGSNSNSCAANRVYAVNTSVSAGGSITPSSPAPQSYNSTITFAINAAANYSILTVDGCGGSLSGTHYTTAPITSDCIVNVSFVLNQSGNCGSANGGTFANQPSSNLCNQVTATPVAGGSTGPWTWQCPGSGTGGTVNCSANTYYGVCGAANGQSYSSAPGSGLCTAGTATAVTGSGPWSWTCTGSASHGGSNSTCSAGVTNSSTSGASNVTPGSSYCSVPSSLATVVPPNILFVSDFSGSMLQNENDVGLSYSSSTTYAGYFAPNVNYAYNSSGKYWYQQTSGSATNCPTSLTTSSNNMPVINNINLYPNANGSQYYIPISTSNIYSGSCLNYWLMTKIDMLRWALTGGTPITCVGSNTFQDTSCDVQLYSGYGTNPINTTACNSTGCFMLTTTELNIFDTPQQTSPPASSQQTVLVPWSSINNNLTSVFQTYSVQPRLGALFFHADSDNPALDTHKVYIGDYNYLTGLAGTPQYDNLITNINSITPYMGTPTGPAMWDAMNYFEQNSPQYGGFSVQSSSNDSGNEWKNPLYSCNSSGANCVLTSCVKNFVILMTDGEWNIPGCNYTSPLVNSTYSESDPVQPAYVMHEGFTNATTGIETSVSSFYTIGFFLNSYGINAVENVAMYGSFSTSAGTWPGGTSGFPEQSCVDANNTCPNGTEEGSFCTSIPYPAYSDWSTTGNNLPDTYYPVSNGASDLYNAILGAVLDALKRASSGTAASVLTTSQGSGAILSQAVFYPERQFGATEVSWTSELQALWYYLDPALQNSTIMENDTTGVDQLNLTSDYVLQFSFDQDTQQTVVNKSLYGNSATVAANVPIENINALWKAGNILWSRNAATDPRTIYTTLDSSTLTSFTGLNTSNTTVQSLLQVSGAANTAALINYIQGIDQSGYRSRTVTIGAANGVWKLGDIVDSTPQIESSSGLNQYNLQPPQGYGDASYGSFISSLDYQTRNMVYASANDGMLHAFELGTLDTSAATGNTGNIKATLCNDTAGQGNCMNETTSITNLGREQWAFIPNNALPYLTYLGSTNYCHLYYVDGPLYVFDASINMLADCSASTYPGCNKQTTVNSNNNLTMNETSWRTVLLGSMGMGGACRYSTGSCNTVAGTTSGQCVKSPLSSSGLSSYFAMDVTTPTSPTLLWEFSNPLLGYSMSGPAIVRISYQNNGVPDNTKNGNWFAVFASGPTGPLTNTQFMGRSDQDLMLFIVDLKTGSLLRTIDTGIPNAFATSVFNAPIDTDRGNPSSSGYYQDNVFYIGYVKQCPSTNTGCSDTTFTNGGVLRVMTQEDPNCNNWVVSKVIDDIGPVTTSVVKLQDTNKGNLWLYFGEGRFFYKTATGLDDANSQRKLYGIMEPCYNSTTNTMNNSCTSTVSASALTDRTTDNSTATAPATGWSINLATSSGSSLAERVITDPLAAPNGIVYFTTFSPNSDLCAFGGNTYIWAVGYDTGTSDIDLTPAGSSTIQTKTVASVLSQGKALIQVSTGSIMQENLQTALGTGRKSVAITGQPPQGQGLSVVINPQPMKQILHIREK